MNRKQRRLAAKQNRASERKLSLSDAIILGVNFHQSGQIEEAEKIYRQVLQVKPGHPDALHYLGVISHQKGEKDEAVELIQKAISCNPAYSDAHNNLGNVLKEIGRLDEAEEAYRYCLSVDPEYVDALCNLGAVLKEKGKYVEALKMLERAITLAPNHSQAYHNLGNALKKLNRYAEAIIAYRKSITLLHPNDSKSYITSVYKSLSRALYIDRNYKEVADVLKQWLEFDPENAAALHMLSACTGENIPARASDAFVEETFDNFAGSFDEILKKLDYQAPELVLSAVQAQIEDTDRQLVILDAGCGTGLCGPLLRDYASQLDGVDLSQGMVDKARDRDIYDDLVVAELTDYIANNSNTYDLIASADTLCYFGDLSSVLRAIFSALTEQGLLVFTVEKIIETEPAEAFRLNPHGRYSHTEEYVISTLNQSGLQLLSITTEHLRKEAGKSVTGMLVTAKKL